MSDPDSQEPISTSSDSSFVILGQGSLPALTNDDLNKNINSDSFSKCKSEFNAINSIDSHNSSDKFQNKKCSLSEEEIQKKLDELINENCQLKETLNQNNLAIKSQLDTFIMWQQEVLKTHETHKQKFLETKDLILKLREENTSLKTQLKESLPGNPTVSGNEIYAQVSKKSEDIDKLKQIIEEYKQRCNDLNAKNENLDAENQNLKEELRTAKNEVLKLNKELEDIGRENMFLKHKNDSTSKNSTESVSYKSLPSSEARAQISNLFEQLELEKGKVIKLTKELEKTKSTESEAESQKLSPTDKLNKYIDKLNNMNDSFVMQNQRYSSLSSWVSLAELNLKENKINEGVEANLLCEIKQLKSHLNQEENMSREKQESLLELQKQFHKLLEDYKALQVKLTSLKNNPNIEKYKEDISSLLTQLETKDKELISKQQECNDLKETVEKLSLECEEIALLRVQVEVYQSDFNDERAARENLAQEKEEMAEQIRYLQSRIRTLEGEKLNSEISVTSPLGSPGKKQKYTCPRCMNSFCDLHKCEEHIEECFDNNFFD